MSSSSDKPLIEVLNLKTWFRSPQGPVRAVDGVSFSIRPGETVALVGESGSGKSVTALSLARLNPEPPARYESGLIFWQGESVLGMKARRLRKLRGGEIAYIFQEPSTALNPVFTVGAQVAEALRLHRRKVHIQEETIRLFRMVGLPDPEKRVSAYPHQLSGGQQQRVMMAMALASQPKLLIADEPTTALDVTIQAQILELLVHLQQELNMAVLLITHNLGLVADVASRVNIMYAGKVVESGDTREVLSDPAHPYTRMLLNAVPTLGGGRSWEIKSHNYKKASGGPDGDKAYLIKEIIMTYRKAAQEQLLAENPKLAEKVAATQKNAARHAGE